jgi:hypothetical protein
MTVESLDGVLWFIVLCLVVYLAIDFIVYYGKEVATR